ncbi:MAG: rhodanese-like domain-containing protein [Flavobacteriaceae bacterium]|nr:rhodanese-like domain-containing protein [Flavobacteriaceae bacterium]
MGFFDFLFKNKQKRVTDFISRNAIIIDVRTTSEYANGAIKGSKNIPLHLLNSKISTIKKRNQPVITCCASGMRSKRAASILKKHGIDAINGGGWNSLRNKL